MNCPGFSYTFFMDGLTGRLFTLIDLLQSQERLTTETLARELAVSKRTVRRDLARLRDLEIQVEVTPGRNGGVTLEPGTLLPALRFTDGEALALGLGLQLVRRSPAVGLEQATKSAAKRLSTTLSERLRQRLEALRDVLVTPPVDESNPNNPLASSLVLDLAEAVKARRSVELSYRSRQQTITSRRVDPYGLVNFEHYWYLAGYCCLRKGVRIFRLDRIRNAHVLDVSFNLPEAFDALKAVTEAIAGTRFPGTVTCRVRLACNPVEASRLIPPATVLLEPEAQGVLMTSHYPLESLEQFALYLLGFPFRVEVLGPRELRSALRMVAERAAKLANR